MSKSFFEEVVELDGNVVVLETEEIEATLVHYRLLCRETGRSIYHWSPNFGMVSLKAADISVPGCRKLVEALRHIVEGVHYGVYILTDFERQLHGAPTDYLRRIATMEHDRKVILLGRSVDLPGSIAKLANWSTYAPRDESMLRPRLRDGRWVV